ncbi:UPF0721 transmembrane protein [Bacterioplanes sanyensis]|uniref:sulfite exporter TauE/SafE family protein n=1 Tax=Bacterioplanes sanyensis TaxID=1249553 RepID=UPI0016754367|nr:sulfite exporter TauE/SafE family protein [Bacterioplanes sanyensis]GGY34729.1 UPF0721 transmembrane protein [Bacterioplanes sanyensis]
MFELWPDPVLLGVAAVGVLLTGVAKSGFAGGIGVVAVPMMAPFIGGDAAIGLLLPVLLLMDGQTVWAFRRQLRWSLIRPLVPGIVVGTACGTWLLGKTDEHSIQLLIGLMGFWVLLQRFAPTLQRTIAAMAGSLQAHVNGGLAGLGSTLAHAGAAPLQAHFLLQRLPNESFLAQVAATIGLMNVLKLLPYGALGLLNVSFTGLSLILIPVAWAGVLLGRWLSLRLAHAVFFRIMMVMLALNSTWLVWQGLSVS